MSSHAHQYKPLSTTFDASIRRVDQRKGKRGNGRVFGVVVTFVDKLNGGAIRTILRTGGNDRLAILRDFIWLGRKVILQYAVRQIVVAFSADARQLAFSPDGTRL